MTKRRGAPLALLVLLLALPTASHGQDRGQGGRRVVPKNDPAPVDQRPSADARLMDLWFARKDALDLDDAARAADLIERMGRIVETENLDRVTWLARGFAFEAYGHLREGNYERARAAYDIARRFDPRLAEAQTGYAWASLHAGRGLPTFLNEYKTSLLLRWGNFIRDGRANMILLAILVLWLVSIVLILIFLLRYQRMLRHDVEERMPVHWAAGASKLAGWIFLLAPLLAWIGGAWLLLYWCVVLGRYMSGKERLVAVTACATVFLSPPLATLAAGQAETSTDPIVIAVQEALAGGFGNQVISELQGAIEQNPSSGTLRLLLAISYERAGHSQEAFEAYQALLQLQPDESRALNNQGNLYLLSAQTGQALANYTRAVQSAPGDPVIYHNLALAQFELLRLDDAEASLKKLQSLDPGLARSLVQAREVGEESEPVSAFPSRDEVWSEVNSITATGPKDEEPLFDFKAPTAVGSLTALLLIGWVSLGRSPTKAQICIRCGEPFCGRCKKELGAKECCTSCIHLFIKQDAIAPEARSKKLYQVERFGRNSRTKLRTASLLLPGAGHLLAGRTFTGAALAVGWLAPMGLLLVRKYLLLPPSLPVLDMPALTTVVAATLMIVVWGGANIFSPRAGN